MSAYGQDLTFYRVDTTASKLLWKCDKHNGLFKLEKGGVVVENKAVVDGLFFININSLKDLDMNVKQFGTAVLIFENTLKNEFLEAKKYPNAFFRIEEIKSLEKDKYTIIGDLTMHGITNCISFDADIIFKGNKIYFKSEKFTIDRTDWGVYRMSPKRPYPDDENNWTVPDNVDITIDMVLVKDVE